MRFAASLLVPLKAANCVMKAERLFVHERSVTPQPPEQGRRSIAPVSNRHWAIDLTRVYCGEDGWGHLAAMGDCHHREIVG